MDHFKVSFSYFLQFNYSLPGHTIDKKELIPTVKKELDQTERTLNSETHRNWTNKCSMFNKMRMWMGNRKKIYNTFLYFFIFVLEKREYHRGEEKRRDICWLLCECSRRNLIHKTFSSWWLFVKWVMGRERRERRQKAKKKELCPVQEVLCWCASGNDYI